MIGPAEAAQQVGADGVEDGVFGQVELVDEVQRGLRAVDLAGGDGPVQRYHGSRCVGEELVVEGEDLRPVPMTAYRTRSGKPTTTFYPSKQLAQNDLGMLLGFFGSAVLAIGSPIAVWPRRRKSLDGVPLNT